jgi:hypothetical protein
MQRKELGLKDKNRSEMDLNIKQFIGKRLDYKGRYFKEKGWNGKQ